jgi:putative glutamine amidotransferase
MRMVMHQKPLAISRVQPNYELWVRKLNSQLPILNFDHSDPALFTDSPEDYAGLLLTGGGDIAPERYDTKGKGAFCQNIDRVRDEIEFRMIEAALRARLPVFAICRGLQVLNVWLGGTLITDIADFSGINIHKGEKDTEHEISIDRGSDLARITGELKGMVNSSHHQAISRLGEGLVITARSTDGIIEAVEMKDKSSFCLAVQWHPERMDFASPFSSGIGKAFFDAM